MIHIRFVPFSLSNQRLWVGIQNKFRSRLLYPLLSNDFLRDIWNELLLHLRNEQLALIFTMQKQELILYPILFIEFIKFSTRFQLFSISTKLRVVRAIDNGICFDLFDTDDEHIPVHVLIHSKNTSTSTHYAGTTYNFGEETYNFDEGWKPRAFYGYLGMFGIRKNDYYALLIIYFIKYVIWCDSANNVYAFLVMYILNYSNLYEIYVIRVPSRDWNFLLQYRMQFFNGMICIHYRIQHRVPYLCNLVQI